MFLLGDYIDRGKHSAKLLDYIINLQLNGFQVYALRGNHEDSMWNSHLKNYSETDLELPGYKWGKDIIDRNRKIQTKYVQFIKNLPYYFVLDNFYLVHAGFNFSLKDPFANYNYMVWNYTTNATKQKTNNRTIIHGHNRQKLSVIKKSIKENALIIGLDNSVFSKKNGEYGNLLCFDLDNYELFVQKRIE